MAMPRALRPVLGPSVASAGVALLALSSALLYLRYSTAVQLMRSDWAYLQFVIRSVLITPNAQTFAFGFAPSAVSLLTFALFAASCITAGWLWARPFGAHPGAAPMAWIGALAAAVVPTLALATVRWPDGAGWINNVSICVAQTFLLALLWWWSRQSPGVRVDHLSRADTPSPSLSPWLKAGVVLALCFAATIVLCGSSGLFGYDSFSNHLADPARWLKAESITRGLPDELVSYYPGNFELLVRWTLSLHTDRLAFTLSFASNVAALWVLYRIAREIGQSRTAAMLVFLGAASLQSLAYQGIIVYSDSFTALCLLLATWLLLVWIRDGAHNDRLTFGFGLALGLALGAKYSAGPPVVVLGLAWLWHGARTGWRDTHSDDFGDVVPQADAASSAVVTRVVRSGAVMAAGVLPTMGYWYVRNTVEQHNPLYPLSVAGMPGFDIGSLLANVPGPKSTLERLTWPWTEVGHVAGYETGLGPVFASVVVLAVCALPFSARRRSPLVLTTWLILLGALIAWWRTGVLVPRYGFYPLLLSFVFVGELWMAFGSRLLAVTLGAGIASTMIAVGHQMVGGAAYNALFYDPAPMVPAIINDLPPSTILNGAGQPSGYYARGADSRHRVISLFKGVWAADVRRLAPDYLLIPAWREGEFVDSLTLDLTARWERQGHPSTSLWHVRSLSPPGDASRPVSPDSSSQ